MSGQLIKREHYSERSLHHPGRCWTAPFVIICLFTLFEFTALQISLPFLQPLRPLLVLTISLAIILVLRFLFHGMDLKDHRIKLVLLFWMLMGLHIPFAYNNFTAYSLTLTMFPYVVLFLGIVTFTNSTKQLALLIHLWLFFHVYQALHGITYAGTGAGGYFDDENDLGVTLCMALPLAYFLFLGSRRFKRILYATCLAILMLGLVATFSRGGFVGLLATSVYSLWKSPKRFAALTTIAIIALLLLTLAPAAYWERMATIQTGTAQGTAEHRAYLWNAAWRMFLDNPLWGVGPGSFRFAVVVYEPPGGFHGQYQGLRALHSTHFMILSELAIPGLIIFASIIHRHFRSIRDISRHVAGSARIRATSRHPERALPPIHANFLQSAAIGLGGGLVGFLAAGAFVSVLYYPQFWTLTGIMVAVHQIWNKYQPNFELKQPQRPKPHNRARGHSFV